MKVTLKDVAQKSGVTISTVQRALNGGGGIGKEKRAFIQKIAAEMGYRQNSYGSQPKKEQMRIAVIFPDTTQENRYYASFLWAGIYHFVNDISPYNIELISLVYGKVEDEQYLRLQECLEGAYGQIDGIVTRGAVSSESVILLKELQDRKTPVVLVGTDIQARYRLCCVRCYEQMAGRVAANMFLSFGMLGGQSKVIVCGNFSGLNQFNNAQGFERELWNNGFLSEVLKIPSDTDLEELVERICSMLKNNKNVRAIYACSTRSTVCACEAVKTLGMEKDVHLIGSDLFHESVQLLKSGQISAIIHNRPYSLAQFSIQALTNYIADPKKAINDTIWLSSDIVMKGNLDFYLRDIPILSKYAVPDYDFALDG